MSLQAIKEFFEVLEYACVDGTEELQEDLFSDIKERSNIEDGKDKLARRSTIKTAGRDIQSKG